MIGRFTHIVDCRETRGIGEGGGIAQRGTYAKSGNELVCVAMSPGHRHITKPVCEITFALREAHIETSTLVLNAGSGVPKDAPGGGGSGLFGVTPKEVLQMEKHNIILFHFGGVKNHIVYKARHALRNLTKPIIIIAQYPLDFEDFAKVGINTKAVRPEKSESKATIVEIITDVIRGESCTQQKLDEIIDKVNQTIVDYGGMGERLTENHQVK
ncbi:methyl-coenzyme M reductase I operon protein C [Methanosphaera cuniculi]|uniref:Methyl-coenzyme M reductase operon protein C n=1 Tax=Methanosphaera cuniculi TaxID=1077256 RepID=A0A2A2HBC7_9EURY|nr:methyl-coenzyme M reductase I operon protein C [Methanosphaera cuniculi]PAV06564.1 methyl-coenzyme M reductase I operon protein C [Methanosphaera cuniculi]